MIHISTNPKQTVAASSRGKIGYGIPVTSRIFREHIFNERFIGGKKGDQKSPHVSNPCVAEDYHPMIPMHKIISNICLTFACFLPLFNLTFTKNEVIKAVCQIQVVWVAFPHVLLTCTLMYLFKNQSDYKLLLEDKNG